MPKIIQPNFSAGEIAPSLYGRVDTEAYRIGLKTARNIFIQPWGTATNRPGLLFSGQCKTHTAPPRLIPFRFNTTDTYIIELGHEYARFLRDGYHLTETPVVITGVTQADPGVVTTSGAHGFSNGDEVYVAKLAGMTELNGRRIVVANVTATTFELTDQVTGSDIDTSAFTAYTSGGEVARIYEIATPYQQDDLMVIKYVQSADIMTLTHPDYAERELSRSGHTSWSLDVVSYVPDIGTPTGLSITPNGADNSVTYTYRVTAIADETFEEGQYAEASTANGATTLTTTDSNTASWSAVTGAFRYNVYKLVNGSYGYLGTTETTSYTDDGSLSPDFDTTPPILVDPFASSNYPGAAGYFNQRKVRGGSNANPDTVWYSRIGDYNNMSVSFPQIADDAITAQLSAQTINQIRHFVPKEALLIFTSGSEWRAQAVNNQGFTAETADHKQQSAWGSNHMRPIEIGENVLFVHELSATVYSIAYSFESDNYVPQDLTILAHHLFDQCSGLVDWAYAPTPHKIIYAIRDDGVCLALTYAKEQQVTAWTHFDTKGAFERVAVIPNLTAREDVAYFVVQRQVNGNTVRYIERLHSRNVQAIEDCFFVDSGLKLDDPDDIEGIEIDRSTGVITVTITSHPYSDGDEILLNQIIWEPDVDVYFNETQPDQLNEQKFYVDDATANTFTLTDKDSNYIDGTEYNEYVGGGYSRKTVSTIYGMHHMAGEQVIALIDGDAYPDPIAVELDGSVVLPATAARVAIGLRYLADLETLNVEVPQRGNATIQGRYTKIPSVTVRFENSRGLYVGQDQYNMVELSEITDEDLTAVTAFYTGDAHITFDSEWDKKGRIFFRQIDPLPVTFLAIIPDVIAGDPQAE